MIHYPTSQSGLTGTHQLEVLKQDTTPLHEPTKVSLLREHPKRNETPSAFNVYNTRLKTKSKSIEVNVLKERPSRNSDVIKPRPIKNIDGHVGRETIRKGVESQYDGLTEMVARHETNGQNTGGARTYRRKDTTQLREPIKVKLVREPLKPKKRQNYNAETKTESEPIEVIVIEDGHHKNENHLQTHQIKVTDEDNGGETNKKGVETKEISGQTTGEAKPLKRRPRSKRRYQSRCLTPDSVISPLTICSENSEGNVNTLEIMITEVYRPWIKRQINVMDILSLLDLDWKDNCEIESINKSCPPDAVDHMLNILADRNILGKWQRLLDALKSKGYIHLSQLLQNETEVHHTHSSKILNLVTDDLAKRICFQDFMLKVFGKGLINSAEREEADAVFKTKGSEAAARVILAYVDRHLPNWDRLFTDILKQSYMSDIAELFEMIERQPSPVQKKPGVKNDLNSEPASRQSSFRGRRVQHFDDNASEQQQTFALSYDQNKQVEVIEVKDFNDLCIAVSEIQTDVKTLLQDVHQLKHLRKEVYV